jgi:hypothetical protein
MEMAEGTVGRSAVRLLIEGILNAIKMVRGVILVAVLVVSLALNVAIVAVDSVAEVAGQIFERVTGRGTAKLLLQQQVRTLGARVAAQERTILANAAGLRRALLAIQLRDRQMALLSRALAEVRTTSAANLARERARGTRLVRATTARISRRIAIDAGNNVSSMVGEAVPWWGIGVIVAATAIELTVDCNNMRDLYDLEAAFDPTSADDTEATVVCGIEVPTAPEIWATTKAKTSSIWNYAVGWIPEGPDINLRFWDW